MKKTYILPFVIVLTIILSGVAFAEDSIATTSKISETKQKIEDLKQKISDIKEKAKEEKASTTAQIKNVKEELKDERKELKHEIEIKIGKKLDEKRIKIANEFEKAIQNLKNLATRTESRISKMEANGQNVLVLKSLLETAKIKITLAETELTNLENLLAEDLPTADATSTQKMIRKAVLENIKTASEKTKSAIKSAHASIVKVIESIKAGQLKEKNSTSTSQTNSTSTNN